MSESAPPSLPQVKNLNNDTFVTQCTVLIVDDNPQTLDLFRLFWNGCR